MVGKYTGLSDSYLSVLKVSSCLQSYYQLQAFSALNLKACLYYFWSYICSLTNKITIILEGLQNLLKTLCALCSLITRFNLHATNHTEHKINEKHHMPFLNLEEEAPTVYSFFGFVLLH
jgi:hypothetical protein